MTAGQIRDTIRAVLCKGLTLEQAEQITRVLVPVRVSAGAPLMREGDGATGLFVLLTGTVEVLKKAPDGSPRSIARVEAPSVLGEMSLVMERPHSATVQAVTDCEIQLLTKSQFQRLISSESVAAYKLIAAIAEVVPQLVEQLVALRPGRVHREARVLLERPLLAHALELARGNQLRAARMLGLNRNTLRKRCRLLQLLPSQSARRAGTRAAEARRG